MSLIIEYKYYFIAGLLLIMLGIFAAIVILFYQTDKSTTSLEDLPGTKTDSTQKIEEQFNYPGSAQKSVTKEWIYYKTATGSIKINNLFPKDYDPEKSNPLVINDNDIYKLQYLPDGDLYEIWIKTGDIEKSKPVVEKSLVDLFGASKDDLCLLPIFLYANTVDQYRPNNYNLGLSFCPIN